MAAFEASWNCAELAHNLCDVLVKKGQLKEKPAFIRTDREAKIAQIFEGIGLNGSKMATFNNPGPLEMMVRKSTNGETWVQHVLEGLTSMLPEDVAKAHKTMTMDEAAKEELAAAKEKSAQRRERMHDADKEKEENQNRDREGGAGGGGDRPKGKGKSDRPPAERNGNDRFARDDRDNDRGGRFDRGDDRGGRFARDDRGDDRGGRFARDRDGEDRGDRGDRREGGKGEGGGRRREGGMDNMECYNCSNLGHSSKDCPEPRKEKGKGKGKGYKDRAEQQCFNCKAYGHRSRDCPEPPDEELVRQRLAAKAEKERKERGE